jgi:hypothetical protein
MKMETLDEIPEEYRERPELYFQKLECEEQKAYINALEEENERLKNTVMERDTTLYEIRCILDITRRGRVPEIRKVLDRAGIKLECEYR